MPFRGPVEEQSIGIFERGAQLFEVSALSEGAIGCRS